MEAENIEFDLRDHDEYPILPDIEEGIPLAKAKKLLWLFIAASVAAFLSRFLYRGK